MDGVRVDPDARTVHVQAGVRCGAVVAAAEPHGLASLNGSAPSVDAVSYTLGGGLGILAREFGYADDHTTRWRSVSYRCDGSTAVRSRSTEVRSIRRCVVQVNHLGGALARSAPNAVAYRDGRFLVRVLTVGDREAARSILDPAFVLLAPDALGRLLNFAFGAGDRGDGLYDAETAKRLAGVKSQCDPANLFIRNYGISA